MILHIIVLVLMNILDSSYHRTRSAIPSPKAFESNLDGNSNNLRQCSFSCLVIFSQHNSIRGRGWLGPEIIFTLMLEISFS